MIWYRNYSLDDLQALPAITARDVNAHLGIRITEIGDDYLCGTVPVDHRTVQPYGLLHGGVSCVLSESLGSMAATLCINAEKQRAVGIEINANHLRPVTEGFVTGVCKPIRVGRTLQVWQTEMFDDSDKMNCISRLTVAIRDV